MSKMKLPMIFKPKHNYKLERIGKDNDGGYLTCVNSIKQTKSLISLGIYDDWSFEKHFKVKNQRINITMYDKSLSFLFLVKRVIIETIKLFIPGRIKNFKKSLTNVFEYFFFTRDKFINKNINKKNFTKILSKKYNNIFLKIDIEGAEYQLLDSIIKNDHKIEGINIEFHSIYKNLYKIKKFLKNINLELVNIHPNNFKYNRPDILELSFSKYPKIQNKKYSYPNNLDMKNDPRNENIQIEFY